MDSTDFVIIMVSGVLIIVAIFLFILYRIFEIKKKNRQVVNLLPEITKIDRDESQTEKFGIREKEIEVLEKRFQKARDFQKNEPDIEIAMEKKEDMPSSEPDEKIVSSKETLQIQKDTNEKLKLQDILIEIRDVKTKKKAKKKVSSIKDLENTNKLKEREKPEKKPIKRPFRKKSEKDQVPEQVKVSEENSSVKKPVKKISAKKKKGEIVSEKPGSGEL